MIDQMTRPNQCHHLLSQLPISLRWRPVCKRSQRCADSPDIHDLSIGPKAYSHNRSNKEICCVTITFDDQIDRNPSAYRCSLTPQENVKFSEPGGPLDATYGPFDAAYGPFVASDGPLEVCDGLRIRPFCRG